MRIQRHKNLKIKNVEIDTRTWRDTYGNTYYSTEARCYSAHNKLVATLCQNYVYGYSGAYHVTVDTLRKKNWLPSAADMCSQGIRVTEHITDGLQRDMKAHGLGE